MAGGPVARRPPCNGIADGNGLPPDGLECGGAYLKLLRENKALHAEQFSNASPYVIMFGPDKCGMTNKVAHDHCHLGQPP